MVRANAQAKAANGVLRRIGSPATTGATEARREMGNTSVSGVVFGVSPNTVRVRTAVFHRRDAETQRRNENLTADERR